MYLPAPIPAKVYRAAPGLVLAFLILLTSSALPTSAASLPGVVRIATAEAEGTEKVGAGFIVAIEGDAAFVVTAWHVVEGGQDIEVTFYTDPYNPRRAVTAGIDERNDLAALRVADVPRGVEILVLGEDLPVEPGTALQLIGFPRRSRNPLLGFGVLAGREGSQLIVDAEAVEGNSGGPVLRSDRVMGVVTEMADRRYVHAVPATIIRLALDSWRIPYSRGSASEAPPPRSLRVDLPPPPTPTGSGTYPCDGAIIMRSGALRQVRSIPSRNAQAAFTIPEGAQIRILTLTTGEGHIWCQIQYSSTSTGVVTGWIEQELVQLSSGCPSR